jgi:flagellar biosynthetic protein FlhB
VADNDQKTYEPTDKKLSDARAKGDVPTAPELRHAAMFAGALVVVGSLGVRCFADLGRVVISLWGRADDILFSPDSAQRFATTLFAQIFWAMAPLFGALLLFALAGGLLQGRPSFAMSRIAPKFSKLSPISGLQRLFGVRALVDFGKTLAKLAMVIGTAGLLLWPHAATIDRLVGVDPLTLANACRTFVMAVLRPVAMLVGALAAFDFIYQRRSWLKRMKMSLQEIRDEHKQNEGDPKIKAKIRQIGMQRARRRMMAAVPDASVVITNPTHFAVALKYDHGRMNAPTVVAKGVDAVALRIREVATAANVPIVENRPLARALYASVEIDHPVPTEHYAAVAEIIGYVMGLARKSR